MNNDLIFLVVFCLIIFLPPVCLLFAFIGKVKRFGSIKEAAFDLDEKYPFPPRHRAIYRSFENVIARDALAHNKLEQLQDQIGTWQADESLTREEILNQIRAALSEIESDLEGGNTNTLKLVAGTDTAEK